MAANRQQEHQQKQKWKQPFYHGQVVASEGELLQIGHLAVPRSQKHIARRALEDIKAEASEHGAWMSAAYRHHDYTMREIADFANVHYSLISKVIKAWEDHDATFKTPIRRINQE